MNPIKSSNNSQFSQSGLIEWNGEPVACLNICKGDLLNKVIYTIATKLCTALEPYDLSTLSLQGVLDILNVDETGDRTLVSVLQLLADGETTLNQKITSLQNQVNGISQISFVIDQKCFKQVDSFGSALPYTLQSHIQDLTNESCANKNLVADLSGKYTVLKNLVDDLDIPDGSEIIVSTCISSDKPVSQALKETTQDHCDLKQSVGDTLKIQQNISKLPADILQEFIGVDGWTINANNLADFIGNLATIIINDRNRIANIEDNCCKVTCKDFSIGFEIVPSADGTAISLRFSEASGTSMPPAFTDKGSVLVITDKNNYSLTYNVIVGQDITTGEFSLVGLDTSDVLNISLTAKVGSDSLQCEKCIGKIYSPASGCPVCAITGTGTSGNVTIVYQTTKLVGKTSSTDFQTVLVSPGGTVYIPKDADIIALNRTGTADVASECIDLLDVEEYVCYSLNYSIGDAGDGATGVLEDDEVLAESIEIMGSVYPLNRNNLQNEQLLADAITAVTPPGLLIITSTETTFDGSDRQDLKINFKTTASISATIKLKLVGTGYPNLYILPESEVDCPQS